MLTVSSKSKYKNVSDYFKNIHQTFNETTLTELANRFGEYWKDFNWCNQFTAFVCCWQGIEWFQTNI